MATARRIVLRPLRQAGLVDLDQAGQGQPSGSTMARRSLRARSQAVLYEPMPSCACNCSAEMPFECAVIR